VESRHETRIRCRMNDIGSVRSDVAIRDNRPDHDQSNDLEKQDKTLPGDSDSTSLTDSTQDKNDPVVLTIVVSDGESHGPIRIAPQPVEKLPKAVEPTDEQVLVVASPKKPPHLSRNSSGHDQCRVCQEEKEECLIDLGCQCRGGLAKAHRSCIDAWFRTRGSNICEICQQISSNVPPPASHPSTSYWVWRVEPAFRGSTIAEERERGCFSPLWMAFSILIGGLLLDVLMSITLGVSALPVSSIISVILVLGIGTAIRLGLEFCHAWSARRAAHRVQTNVNLGYHPAL